MNIFKSKFFYIPSFIVLIFIFIVSIALQFRFENYITTQNLKYRIIEKRTRLHYKPVVIYLLELKLSGKHRDDRRVSQSIYNKSIQNLELKSYSSYGLMDEYIVYCYFSEEEKNQLLSTELK